MLCNRLLDHQTLNSIDFLLNLPICHGFKHDRFIHMIEFIGLMDFFGLIDFINLLNVIGLIDFIDL